MKKGGTAVRGGGAAASSRAAQRAASAALRCAAPQRAAADVQQLASHRCSLQGAAAAGTQLVPGAGAAVAAYATLMRGCLATGPPCCFSACPPQCCCAERLRRWEGTAGPSWLVRLQGQGGREEVRGQGGSKFGQVGELLSGWMKSVRAANTYLHWRARAER